MLCRGALNVMAATASVSTVEACFGPQCSNVKQPAPRSGDNRSRTCGSRPPGSTVIRREGKSWMFRSQWPHRG